MDVFKLRVSDKKSILITRKNFEYHTKEQHPWYQSLDGKKESHLAVCPACDNTITIIGLHASNTEIDEETGEVSIKKYRPPHGRHYLFRSLEGLGTLDREEYEHCPYSGKSKLSIGSQHSKKSTAPSRILQIISSDFDRIVYLFERSTGISLSLSEATKMLLRYKQSEGWKYAGSTVMNIPWMFAYFSRSTSLMFKQIKNEPLRDAVTRRYPSATFTGKHFKLEPDGEFIRPCFCFMDHKRQVKDEHLEETIDLVVSDEKDNQEFYRETIKFDPLHFDNLLQSKETKYRKEKLITVGKSHFSSL